MNTWARTGWAAPFAFRCFFFVRTRAGERGRTLEGLFFPAMEAYSRAAVALGSRVVVPLRSGKEIGVVVGISDSDAARAYRGVMTTTTNRPQPQRTPFTADPKAATLMAVMPTS